MSAEQLPKPKKAKKAKKAKPEAPEPVPEPAAPKKKKKKSKAPAPAVAVVPEPAPAKKKKKKSKKAADATLASPPAEVKQQKKRKAEAEPPAAATAPVKKAKTSGFSFQSSLSEAEVKALRTKHVITVDNWDMHPMTSFDQVDIPKHLMQSCASFERPSPIQSEVWAPLRYRETDIPTHKRAPSQT